jgi:hypothetical protein
MPPLGYRKYSVYSRHRTYGSWYGAIDRCTNPSNDRWADYGGRGIKVCHRSQDSFQNFLDDMGKRPVGLTLHRVNNDGDYKPSNCIWADLVTQANNKRNRNSVKTKCWRGHPLVKENLEPYALARGMRKCVECKRSRDRERYLARSVSERPSEFVMLICKPQFKRT